MNNSINKPAVLSSPRVMIVVGLIIGLVVAFGIYYLWFTNPPQMGSDPKVFKTVDALYTCIRNRDLPQLQACEKKLDEFHKEGTLSAASYQYLTEIIKQAKKEEWQSAVSALYQFMRVQQRKT